MIVTGKAASRTPPRIVEVFREIGSFVREKSGWVRSGHASKGEAAIEDGAGDRALVYLPWTGFNDRIPLKAERTYVFSSAPYLERMRSADAITRYFQQPGSLSEDDHLVLSRNWLELFGFGGKPSTMLICWSPDRGDDEPLESCCKHAIRIAKDQQIPVLNLGAGEYAKKKADKLLEICKAMIEAAADTTITVPHYGEKTL